MELHQLRYFCAAAETGSFTRGARSEHVTQPTLSHQLLKLEKELGTKLFDRSHRRIQLTTSGRIFLRSVKLILKQLNEAKQKLLNSPKEQAESITIGCVPTFTQHPLSPIVCQFSKTYPWVTVQVIDDLQLRLLSMLRSGLLDMALVVLPIGGQEFRTKTVMRQSVYAAVPTQHPLARRKQVRLVQLRHDPFLLLREGFRFGTIAREALRDAQIEPEVKFEGSSIDNILGMVSAGAGISLVPQPVAKRTGCRFIPVQDVRRTALGWAMLRSHTLTPAQRLFLETSSSRLAHDKSAAPHSI